MTDSFDRLTPLTQIHIVIVIKSWYNMGHSRYHNQPSLSFTRYHHHPSSLSRKFLLIKNFQQHYLTSRKCHDISSLLPRHVVAAADTAAGTAGEDATTPDMSIFFSMNMPFLFFVDERSSLPGILYNHGDRWHAHEARSMQKEFRVRLSLLGVPKYLF